MQFAQPILLWALAGLSIPIGIHLLSRKEGKVIKMGSLRFLQETSTQQFKGIKLNEILLLIVRSVLIILFVFMISGLQWKEVNKRWLVVETGLEKNASAKTILDSLGKKGFEIHWLQRNFPQQRSDLNNNFTGFWEAASSLRQQELLQAVVLSSSRIEDFKGAREMMDDHIQWITLPTEPTNFVAQAFQTPNQLLIRQGHSEAEYTRFETVRSKVPVADSIEIAPLPTIKVALVTDVKYQQEKLIIKAALSAIESTLPVTISIAELTSEKVSDTINWVFWLSEKKVELTDSVNYVIYQPQASSKLIEQIERNKWAICKPMTLDVARKNNLTIQLASLLIDEKSSWNKIAHYDRRVLSDTLLMHGTSSTDDNTATSIAPPVNKWLLITFLLVLFFERSIAYQRNQ
jgi:hypothetical protein